MCRGATQGRHERRQKNRNLNDQFTALMDGFMPNWRVCRDVLNSGWLGYDTWQY